MKKITRSVLLCGLIISLTTGCASPDDDEEEADVLITTDQNQDQNEPAYSSRLAFFFGATSWIFISFDDGKQKHEFSIQPGVNDQYYLAETEECGEMTVESSVDANFVFQVNQPFEITEASGHKESREAKAPYLIRIEGQVDTHTICFK